MLFNISFYSRNKFIFSVEAPVSVTFNKPPKAIAIQKEILSESGSTVSSSKIWLLLFVVIHVRSRTTKDKKVKFLLLGT